MLIRLDSYGMSRANDDRFRRISVPSTLYSGNRCRLSRPKMRGYWHQVETIVQFASGMFEILTTSRNIR